VANNPTELPSEFIAQMTDILGQEECHSFTESFQQEPATSIRLNPKKAASVWPGLRSAEIPWAENGYMLSERPKFTLDPLFHAGAYYVQEASSMLVSHVMAQLRPQLGAQIKILDLCAAPGGKSTLLSNHLQEDDILFSNEVIRSRAQVLADQIQKWGNHQVIVLHEDPEKLGASDLSFDIILVDAPCSGEGMFRKDPASISEWSPAHVQHCSARQRRILYDILPALSPNGFLIYSTCTYNKSENISNLQHFASETGLQSVEIPMPESWQVTTVQEGPFVGYQCFPHRTVGEGFFFGVLHNYGRTSAKSPAKINGKLTPLSKTERAVLQDWLPIDGLHIHPSGQVFWIPEHMLADVQYATQHFNLVYSGLRVGKLQKQLFIPDHAMALSTLPEVQSLPSYACTRQEAIDFLAKDLHSIADGPRSWVRMCYEGHGIGWVKNLGNRINNYLPDHWKIKNKNQG